MNSKPKKSSSSSSGSFSVWSFFKPGNNNRRAVARTWDDGPDDYSRAGKVWPSKEDNTNKARWVADPRIDTKASVFISHFHATCVSESELQVFQQPPMQAAAGNK